MKQIYKKISLEQFKCRTPNTLVSFFNENYVSPSKEMFYLINPNGNYGFFPSDIILPDTFTSTTTDKVYDFTTVTDVLSTSINLLEAIPDTIFILSNEDYLKLKVDGYKVSKDNGETWNRYLSYRKLVKWFNFFKNYFTLLSSTTCRESDKKYLSAEEYYYSDNDKDENETLEYFQEMDKLFVARGGVIEDDGTRHCDLYEWLRDFIFLEYDLEISEVETENGIVKLKKYAKEWLNTKLNVVTLFQWYSWFDIRHDKYSEVTDCHLMDEDGNVETSCCDCQEYFRLGGNDMFLFLKQCINDYYIKASEIVPYCTYTATMNIQIPITTSFNNVGEQTILSENWEGGVDYSPKEEYMVKDSHLGTVITYGGSSFHKEDDNEILTIAPTTYVSSTKDYLKVDEDDSCKYGYYYNKYKELGFIVSGDSIYSEYLPYYIKNNEKEFKVKDVENFKTYAYKDSKMIYDPTIETMSDVHSIITPSNEDTHFFCIDSEIYESFRAKILRNEKDEIVSGKVNPIIVEYTEGDATPYVVFNKKTYYGYYFDDIKDYKFTFVKIPKHSWDWYTIDNEGAEFIIYKGIYSKVENEETVVVQNGINLKYHSLYGYIDFNGLKTPIIETEDALVCGEQELNDDVDGYSYGWRESDSTQFHERIENLEEWNHKKGYWIEDDVLHYIEPYKEYELGVVHGTVKSRLDELMDVVQSFDNMGNLIHGYVGNKVLYPKDNEIFDFYYHIGNTSDLVKIYSEENDSKIIYSNVESRFNDYYRGNVITEIAFYFKDENGNMYIDEDGNEEITFVSGVYEEELDSSTRNISNIPFIWEAIKKHVTKHDTSVFYDEEEDKYYISITTAVTYDINDEEMANPDIEPIEVEPIDTLRDIIMELSETNPLYCRIRYSIGGIIQRPYTNNAGSSGKEYIYGSYQLTDDYHKGVQYEEEYIVSCDNEEYYIDNDNHFLVDFLTLLPTEEVVYYMDEQPDEFSEEFVKNMAHFVMETNYDLTKDDNKMFSKNANSSNADKRELDFYNGLMAAPTFVEEYNLGISSLRHVKDDVYVNRGVNYAYDKHLKLLEIRSLEALEQYGNGFYNIR